MKARKIATLFIASFGLVLASCNGFDAGTSSSVSVPGPGGGGNNDGGGNNSGQGGGGNGGGGSSVKQKSITREQASAIAKDIKTKQDANNPKANSALKSQVKLAKPVAKYSTGANNNNDRWEYGDEDYWKDYSFDEDDYDTDWTYDRDDDYESWAWDESTAYDAWLAERTKAKSIKIPDRATLKMYEEYSYSYAGISMNEKYEIDISYSLADHYAREHIKETSSGGIGQSIEADIVIYYADGNLHAKVDMPNSEYSGSEEVMPVSGNELEQAFAEFKEEIQEYFIEYSEGQNMLNYVDELKDYGFNSAYYSDDAGNLVMEINGKTTYNEDGNDLSLSADINTTWDEYLMRSCNAHYSVEGTMAAAEEMGGASGEMKTEMHMIYGFSDHCEISYPGYNGGSSSNNGSSSNSGNSGSNSGNNNSNSNQSGSANNSGSGNGGGGGSSSQYDVENGVYSQKPLATTNYIDCFPTAVNQISENQVRNYINNANLYEDDDAKYCTVKGFLSLEYIQQKNNTAFTDDTTMYLNLEYNSSEKEYYITDYRYFDKNVDIPSAQRKWGSLATMNLDTDNLNSTVSLAAKSGSIMYFLEEYQNCPNAIRIDYSYPGDSNREYLETAGYDANNMSIMYYELAETTGDDYNVICRFEYNTNNSFTIPH